MKKPYLVICGEYIYPAVGTGDWIGCFKTRKEAEQKAQQAKGNNEGVWTKVIDLREWTEK